MYVGEHSVVVADQEIRNGVTGAPYWDTIMEDVRSNSSVVKTVPEETCRYKGITFKVPLTITKTMICADIMKLEEEDMHMLKCIYPQDFNVVIERWKKAWLDKQVEKEFWGE